MQQKKLNPLVKANELSRRQFLRRTSMAAGAAAMYFPYVGRVLGANDRINVACIGVGGKGNEDSTDIEACGGNMIAICDVDRNNLDKKAAQFASKYPDLKKYHDYRQLLDECGKDIDAVTVTVPDHNHGVAAIRALTMGKHTFCQKPLVQTVNEARIVRRLAIEKKLATQMGNQGSAEPGLRRAVEVVQAGVIGNPLELHVWSNRPIWPQGIDRPAGEDKVPETLDWDCWLGPAKPRPYKGNRTYHDFNWRGWFEFGTGALGDMACHTVNMPFRAMKLGYPNVVELEDASTKHDETYPLTSRIRFEFPERDGLPPVKFWWYDGNPTRPGTHRPEPEIVKEIVDLYGRLPISGALIIGDKGKLFSADDYGTSFVLMLKGESEYTAGDQHPAVKDVPQTIPRLVPMARQGGGFGAGGGASTNLVAGGTNLVAGTNAVAGGRGRRGGRGGGGGGGGGGRIGTRGHMNEWYNFIKTGTPSYSHFEIAGYLAEVILLGCVALRVGQGKRMEWDGPKMMSPNLPEAAQFTKRENRAGWTA